jgi:hypothetical protein
MGVNLGFSLATIKDLADVYGWKICDINNTYKMVSFTKGNAKLSIYYTVGSVSVVIDDDVKTRKFIKNIKLKELKSLFDDPEW